MTTMAVVTIGTLGRLVERQRVNIVDLMTFSLVEVNEGNLLLMKVTL